mgnify:CR=1 FL=1
MKEKSKYNGDVFHFFQKKSTIRKHSRRAVRKNTYLWVHVIDVQIYSRSRRHSQCSWKIRFKTQFLTQLTYMIMNRFSRIEITILFPNQIGNQFVSKNTFGIGNEQCQYIKLLTCQVDHPFPNPDSAVFQA